MSLVDAPALQVHVPLNARNVAADCLYGAMKTYAPSLANSVAVSDSGAVDVSFYFAGLFRTRGSKPVIISTP